MMEIRKATKNDLKEIARLMKEYAKYENNLDENIKVGSLKKIEKEERVLFGFGTKYALAEEDKKILGVLGFNIDRRGKEKIGAIHSTIVLEKARKKGVGKSLVVYVLKYFKKNNCRRVRTFIHKNNKNAINFWAKQGFETTEGYSVEKMLG